MAKTSEVQQIISDVQAVDQLETWAKSFLRDRQAQNLAKGTIRFYTEKLNPFIAFCHEKNCTTVAGITADLLRSFMLHLEESGHAPGGVHGYYRALRAFMNWYEAECEPENWKNPIRKVRPPKCPELVIDPVSLDTVQALIDICGRDFCGLRDRALILFLFDTGVRANECLALNLDDADVIGGGVLIRMGKGRKPRMVFMGRTTRRAVRGYLKTRRGQNIPALWVTDEGERLTYGGLRQIIRRRSEATQVTTPALHDFRRGFALNCLRNGMDIYSLQKLMGHRDLQVLRRYLKQTDEDIQTAHQKASPVDRMKGAPIDFD